MECIRIILRNRWRFIYEKFCGVSACAYCISKCFGLCFAADEIDEISVDVALLEDMLTTISTNTSDLIFSNKYSDYGYDVCGSKDSCYIIRLIENLSDPNYKSKYGVIDAESKKFC